MTSHKHCTWSSLSLFILCVMLTSSSVKVDLPESSFRCFESSCCGSGKTCKSLPCVGFWCDSFLSTRTCGFTNLYGYDGEWLFYSKNASSPVVPFTAIHDYQVFRPRLVHRLPTNVHESFQGTTVFLDQKWHGNFGHWFLEHMFTAYWILAATRQTWILDPKELSIFWSFRLRGIEKRSYQEIDKNTGKVTKNYVMGIKAVTGNPVLHHEHNFMRREGLLRFKEVIVGGFGGRSPYTNGTYPGRPRQLADLLYTDQERAVAYLNYAEQILRSIPGRIPPRSEREASPKRLIMIFNREYKLARHLTNADQLLARLKEIYPKEEVYPDIVYPSDVNTLALLFLNVTLLITPHGSQMSNIILLSPGAGVLEISKDACPFTRGHDYISYLSGIQHHHIWARPLKCPPNSGNKGGDNAFWAARHKNDLSPPWGKAQVDMFKSGRTHVPQEMGNSYSLLPRKKDDPSPHQNSMSRRLASLNHTHGLADMHFAHEPSEPARTGRRRLNKGSSRKKNQMITADLNYVIKTTSGFLAKVEERRPAVVNGYRKLLTIPPTNHADDVRWRNVDSNRSPSRTAPTSPSSDVPKTHHLSPEHVIPHFKESNKNVTSVKEGIQAMKCSHKN